MDNLKSLRLCENKKVDDIAKYLNVTIQSYYKYENGKAEPNIENLIKLADFYQVTLDYLVGRSFGSEFSYLNELEKTLISDFRKLSATNQAKILGEVTGMLLVQN